MAGGVGDAAIRVAVGVVAPTVVAAVVYAMQDSELVRVEKLAWAKDHRLQVDATSRNRLQGMVRAAFILGRELQLCFKIYRNVFGLVRYEHWFVKSGDWIIEFGNGEGLTGHTVCLHNNPRSDFTVEHTYKITRIMIERMVCVVGATNYSLLLRNCEHVSNYIAEGRWLSLQTLQGNDIGQALLKFVPNRQIQALRNTLPRELKPPTPENINHPIYHQADRVRYSRREDVLDAGDSNAYNVLVLGVTGVGKSSLINMLFNRRVCACSNGVYSMTSSMEFHVGSGVTPGNEVRGINIIDSVGYCDSHLSADKVAEIIKEAIKGNCKHLNKVLIVHTLRMPANGGESIKKMLQWLRYDRRATSGPSLSVSFIYTKADGQDETERNQRAEELCDCLQARFIRGVNAFAVSFPPGAPFEQVQEDRQKLMRQVFDIPTDPIQVPSFSF